jgi:hypothetical protein
VFKQRIQIPETAWVCRLQRTAAAVEGVWENVRCEEWRVEEELRVITCHSNIFHDENGVQLIELERA